jgi:hypothetical protein
MPMETIPHFHDGNVTGIRVRKDAATIYLQQVDGSEFDLVLDGLEALHIDDFRKGNTISMVEIVRGHAPYGHLNFDALFPPPHPSAAAQYHEAYTSFMKRQVERIESGEVCLVLIVPSYGAELMAICREINCRPS